MNKRIETEVSLREFDYSDGSKASSAPVWLMLLAVVCIATIGFFVLKLMNII